MLWRWQLANGIEGIRRLGGGRLRVSVEIRVRIRRLLLLLASKLGIKGLHFGLVKTFLLASSSQVGNGPWTAPIHRPVPRDKTQTSGTNG